MRKHSPSAAPAVFINCPFDRSYRPLFDAIVFAVMALGFEPRCALERDTGTQERLKKIVEIIHSCQFGIHDLSFMRVDRWTKLPRYNMAFELGLFLGCCEFGGKGHAGKSCLILDRERWRYRKSLSDLSGRDIQGHNSDPKQAVIPSEIGWRRNRSSPTRRAAPSSAGNTGDSGRSFRAFVGAPNSEYLNFLSRTTAV
jgi:hypothetical protein